MILCFGWFVLLCTDGLDDIVFWLVCLQVPLLKTLQEMTVLPALCFLSVFTFCVSLSGDIFSPLCLDFLVLVPSPRERRQSKSTQAKIACTFISQVIFEWSQNCLVWRKARTVWSGGRPELSGLEEGQNCLVWRKARTVWSGGRPELSGLEEGKNCLVWRKARTVW